MGKYIEREWNISPGMNKTYGKLLFVKNSKRGTKLIISYRTVEETEDDGEDVAITLVQFVTDVLLCTIHVFLLIYTFYILYVFNTYPNVFQIIYYLG